MKLKKIASLMLAGVMAVSMLAGCSGKSNNNENNGQNQTEQVVSKVADYANQTLTSTGKKYMTYKDSTSLAANLKDVATDKSKFSADDIHKVWNGDYFATFDDDNMNNQKFNNDMAKALADKMNGIEVYANSDYVNHKFTELPANKAEKTIVWVYTVPGVLTEELAVNAAAGHLTSWMDGENFISGQNIGGDYDCKYSADIAALKVTNSNLTLENAWVIAIAVTQNVTKSANATV